MHILRDSIFRGISLRVFVGSLSIDRFWCNNMSDHFNYTSFCERPAWSINVVCGLQLLLACLDLAGGTVMALCRIESMEWVLTVVGKHGGGTMLPLAPRKCSNAATPRSTAFISSILPILLLNQPEVISTQQTAAKAPKEAFSKQWSNVNVGGRSWNWHWLCSQVVPN